MRNNQHASSKLTDNRNKPELNNISLQSIPMTIPEEYHTWLLRFHKILLAYQAKLIPLEELEKYQIFLLDTAQFNASFTLSELEKLHYPRSPFAIMSQNTYLRSTDTWAMQILRELYRTNTPQNKKLYPIWIDSDLFLNLLGYYFQVLHMSNYDNDSILKLEISKLWQRKNASEGITNKSLLIEVTKNEMSSDCVNVKQAIKKQLLICFFMENKIDEKLHEILLNFFNEPKCEIIENQEILEALQCLLPEVLNTNNIESNKNNDIKEAIVNSAKEYLEKNIIALYKNAIFYTLDMLDNIQAIVITTDNIKDINQVLDQTGYRIDPVKAVRCVLKKYPKLFVDKTATEDFLKKFFKIRQIDDLSKKSKDEVKLLKNIQNYIINSIANVASQSTEFISCNFALTYLEEESANYSEGLKLYCDYLLDFLKQYYLPIVPNSAVHVVADEEVKKNINSFQEACRKNEISTAVRSIQSIAEIMLLTFEEQPIQRLLTDVYRQDYLPNYNVQEVMMTPYAMRALVHALQLLDDDYIAASQIYVTNQIYYEFVLTLNKFKQSSGTLQLVQHVGEIAPEVEICFIDIHPNSLLASKQFAHDFSKIFLTFASLDKPRTLVVDATLNSLDDDEIKNLLAQAKVYIDAGKLNLIFIQSLTKFSQLGLDKRSAGLIVVLNQGSHWTNVNNRMRLLRDKEIIDFSTAGYFTYFLNKKLLLNSYISQINNNVRFVYYETNKMLSNLEIINRRLLQLTLSSDPKACYIALNMNGLLAEVDANFSMGKKDIEKFAKDVVEYLIFPLCEFHNLPITNRPSIGFPLTSINFLYDSLRITVGLESKEQLIKYAEIFAYTSFVLNRQWSAKTFFNDSNNNTSFRTDYFKEKVEQYKAMTPNSNASPYEGEFETIHWDESNTHDPSNGGKKFNQKLIIKNGEVQLIETEIDSQTDEGRIYGFSNIYIPVRGIGVVRLDEPRVNLLMKQMSIACLTRLKSSNGDVQQNVNLHFNDREGTLTFASFQIYGFDDYGSVYGPFHYKPPVYFYIYQKKIQVIIDKKDSVESEIRYFPEENIKVKQGHLITPLLDIPLEDREFIIRCHTKDFVVAPYFICKLPRMRNIYPPEKPEEKEEYPGRICLTTSGNVLIEFDFMCCKKQGITVYKRFLSNQLTSFEIDYWGEADPIVARFLRLMIAIFVKERTGQDFITRDRRFVHFLFNLNYKEADELFANAIDEIAHNKNELQALLNNKERQNSNEHYQFAQEGNTMSWPAGCSYENIIFTCNKTLIMQALDLLNIERNVSIINISNDNVSGIASNRYSYFISNYRKRFKVKSPYTAFIGREETKTDKEQEDIATIDDSQRLSFIRHIHNMSI